MGKRKIKALGVVLGLVTLLCGCQIGDTQFVFQKNTANKKEVFTLNGEACSLTEAKLYLSNYRNIYGNAYGIELWGYDFGEDSLEEYIKEVMRAGADGYLLKKSADSELIEAIHKIYEGKKYLNETISQTLIDSLLRAAPMQSDMTDPYVLLSIREREVLRYLAKGFTNSEIASILSLSPKTIDTYRSRIMNKLNIKKKSELVNYAMEHHLFNI